MNADPVERQKADFPRLIGNGDIKNTQPGAPALLLHIADRLPHRAGVVDLLVGEAGIGKEIPGVDHQQQVVVRLQVDVPGAGRRGDVVHRFGFFGSRTSTTEKPWDTMWPI